MMFSLVAVVTLFLAIPAEGMTKVILLAAAQLALLVCALRERKVTAVGTFIFMSFVFFALRPLFVMANEDFALLSGLRISADESIIGRAMWWGTAAMIVFVLGGHFGRKMVTRHTHAWSNTERYELPLVEPNVCQMLLAFQVASLGFIAATHSALSYDGAFGAYGYDLPVLLQGGQVFSVLAITERVVRSRGRIQLLLASSSFFIFLAFTILIRSTSIFRGQWLTGVLILGLAIGIRLRQRIPLAYIAVPLLILLPAFRALGELRYVSNDEFLTEFKNTAKTRLAPSQFFSFLDSEGDINIFDTFTAALQSEPETRPYLLPWLYVPVHWVPRKVWPSKPEGGIMEDMQFTYGAPYSPGIAGFFLLDGGCAWMLGCMALLGALVGAIESWIQRRLRGYFGICFYSALVINAIFLTRCTLFQTFYQTLYFVLPCYLLNNYVSRHSLDRASVLYRGRNSDGAGSRDHRLMSSRTP